jgi:hypothetical protein
MQTNTKKTQANAKAMQFVPCICANIGKILIFLVSSLHLRKFQENLDFPGPLPRLAGLLRVLTQISGNSCFFLGSFWYLCRFRENLDFSGFFALRKQMSEKSEFSWTSPCT